MRFERHHEPLLTRKAFLLRMLGHVGAAVGIVLGSLGLGIVGYHVFAGLTWIDALLNAAMLLGGMGPVSELHSVGAKVFASAYALYAGVVFLLVAGVLLAPVFHRILHHFHLEFTEEGLAGPGDRKHS